jgi:sugar O-acyltransferase (sialic acid O-acetyltransferase NeuD family)
LNDQVVIFAAEGVLAQESVETLTRLDISIAAAVVTAVPEWDMMGLTNVIDVTSISDKLAMLPVIVPVWAPTSRKAAVEKAIAAGFTDFMTVVDPTAIVAQSARLGKGVYIHTGANVGAGAKIGDFCLVNRGSLISHHCVLDSYVTTGSGVTLSSRCHIGENAVLGAGSAFIPDCKIGDNVTVAAGAAVHRNASAGTTIVGNPARAAMGKKRGVKTKN